MKLLITGGCGFLGSNLAKTALDKGYELAVLDNLSRVGSRQNLEWLKTCGSFKFVEGDTRSQSMVEALVSEFRPEAVFHLAGQVAMTTSLADPRSDFDTNVVGGMNILDAVRRKAPNAVVIYSSTNKVYGDLGHIDFYEEDTRYIARGYERGFDESLPLNFQSPYGCSKGAMDQYMLDFHRMFGVNTIVFRHSSIYGGRQFSTFDQGWIGWFVSQALLVAKKSEVPFPISIAGTGKQVRDVLFASDIVNCYFQALKNSTRAVGQAFNIGGGMGNSLSILELFKILENALNVQLSVQTSPWRLSDQKVFVADNSKAGRLFGWKPQITAKEGVSKMIEWMRIVDSNAQS